MKYAITGILDKTRDQAIEIIKQELDWEHSKNISSCDYLIVGDKPGANKLVEAAGNKVKIIYEGDFLEKFLDDEWPEIIEPLDSFEEVVSDFDPHDFEMYFSMEKDEAIEMYGKYQAFIADSVRIWSMLRGRTVKVIGVLQSCTDDDIYIFEERGSNA